MSLNHSAMAVSIPKSQAANTRALASASSCPGSPHLTSQMSPGGVMGKAAAFFIFGWHSEYVNRVYF